MKNGANAPRPAARRRGVWSTKRALELTAWGSYATRRLGPKTDLERHPAFVPRNPQQVVLDSPLSEFTVGPLPENMARQYLYRKTNAPAVGLEYYGVLFTFRVDIGGTLSLLWVREDGKWKIASYQPFNQ
jgi:hypothetical protein